MALSVGVLRELFRNLQAWQSLFETEGIDILIAPDGAEWSLWDILKLYQVGQDNLPRRQRQAIRLCLVLNMREEDAAALMGVSRTNPVASYASTGLARIIEMVHAGSVIGYQEEAAS